jgi:magnesium transporter
MVNPNEQEIQTVCENVKINDQFIRDALDFEEKARIDQEDDDQTILFVVDVPIIEKSEGTEIYSTMPIGMIVVRDEFFITVSLRKNKVIEDFEKRKIKNFQTYKKTRFIFQILYLNASYYLTYLKQINKETEFAEYVLKNSMRNKELLKMLSLEKSLVYFATSLKSNEVVMEKTLRGKIIKLYDEDEDILEDAITENKQAIEMAQIYNNILNGTMDAYASIISNNLNGVMKTLTSITIILAVPTMISSFWGMNVHLPLQDSPYGFIVMILIAILTTVIVTVWLNKKDMLK